MTRRKWLVVAVVAGVVLLVACWAIVGTIFENRRGKFLQFGSMICVLGQYADETDGLWPASLEALKHKGLVEASDRAGFYRIANDTPFHFDETVPAHYLECLRFGVVDGLYELKSAEGYDLVHRKTGNVVELVDLAQLDSYERTMWPALGQTLLWALDERGVGPTSRPASDRVPVRRDSPDQRPSR